MGDAGHEGNESHEGNEGHEEGHEAQGDEGCRRGGSRDEGHEGNESHEGHEGDEEGHEGHESHEGHEGHEEGHEGNESTEGHEGDEEVKPDVAVGNAVPCCSSAMDMSGAEPRAVAGFLAWLSCTHSLSFAL